LDLRPGKDAGAQLLARRASVKRILHDDNGAVDDCSTSLRLMPNNPDGLWQRALTYIDLKQLDAAVPDLQKLVQQQPRFANGHYTLAECYMSLGRAKDAQTEYQRAVDLFAVQHDEQGRKMAMQRLAQIPDASTQQ
jgi:predicted Zn-dependent protease